MKNGSTTTTIDKSGRIIIPKEIRDQAQFQPGMELRVTLRDGRVEIEPEPVEIKIVQKGPFAVAVAMKPVPPLTHEMVQRMIDEDRERRGMIDDDEDRR
ncbi:MAG: AbrB/MazE/SpoVT family DNA-binding domain-containing protein [Acidobacteriota bacterium]